MLLTKTDLAAYLASDLAAHNRTSWRFYDRWLYPVLYFQRYLRHTEYVVNTSHSKFRKLYTRFRLRGLGRKLGFTIYPNNFGPGLSIPHWGTIIVNRHVRVGSDCRIHPGTCIGWNKGAVPSLGNHCYIGPGAKVFGGVVLGDHTRVGANAVVTKSFAGGYVTLYGAPARAYKSVPDISGGWAGDGLESGAESGVYVDRLLNRAIDLH